MSGAGVRHRSYSLLIWITLIFGAGHLRTGSEYICRTFYRRRIYLQRDRQRDHRNQPGINQGEDIIKDLARMKIKIVMKIDGMIHLFP